MPTTMNKQQLLDHVYKTLKKQYEVPAEAEKRPELEHLLYAIVREGATRKDADRAFKALRTQFFDWNEVRVSSPRELEEALAGIPAAGERASRIIGVLQYWFELYYNFNMDDLAKKGLKDAARQLARMLGEVAKGGMKEAGRVPARVTDGNDFVVASVIQQGLGGHAVPLDGPALRVLRRLNLVEPDAEGPEGVRASIEHHVPKAKGAAFNELLSAHAAEVCREENPRCSACPLLEDCPTGQERVTRTPEPKPRKSR
jgi:endonuclease III